MTEEFWARAEKQGGIEVAITDKGIKVRVPDSKNPAPPAPYTLEDAIWDIVADNDETRALMAIIAERCWLKDEERELLGNRGLIKAGWHPVKEIKKEEIDG